MKFGVRQIVNVVFKAKSLQTIGAHTFQKGQPVFYMDSAKTSTLEGSATTVYAEGGRGNAKLIAWEGEKNLTFTVEDALLSPVSFAMLSGAGLIKASEESTNEVHFHQTTNAISAATTPFNDDDPTATYTVEIDLADALEANEKICETAPIYVMKLDSAGDITGEVLSGYTVSNDGKKLTVTGLSKTDAQNHIGTVMVDYYVLKAAKTVSEMQIDADNFAGYYYVEADTLFRNTDGKDLPANITLPNVKIQSNFTFSMAATGDPSTFSFTMDAFPGYTYFNRKKKVLCAIQVVDDGKGKGENQGSVFPHLAGFDIDESKSDSVAGSDETMG